MTNTTQRDPTLDEVLTKIVEELEAIKVVTTRTETRLCKLIVHQGAKQALKPTFTN